MGVAVGGGGGGACIGGEMQMQKFTRVEALWLDHAKMAQVPSLGASSASTSYRYWCSQQKDQSVVDWDHM